MGVLDALLLREEFNPAQHARDWHGRFRVGDMVRLKHNGPDGLPVVGRIQRFSQDGKKAIVDPVRGGAHVEAGPSDIAFHTPKSVASAIKRSAEAEAKRLASSGVVIPSGKDSPNFAERRRARTGMSPEQERAEIRRQSAKRMGRTQEGRGAGVGVLLEAFAALPTPVETPQQSQALGAKQVAAAKAWDAAKHPRAAGGRFGSKGGRSKSATRSPRASSRYLAPGARGGLVSAIQRQLHIAADGQYGTQTRAAVSAFQRQHGLQVDGVVGAQTLAALRGHPNARSIAPGPIATRAARVRTHRTQRVSRAQPASRGQTRAGKIAKTPIPTPWTPVGGHAGRFAGGQRV